MCHDPVGCGFLNLHFVPRRWCTNRVQILRFNNEKAPFCIESTVQSSSILKIPFLGNQWYTVFLMKELDLAYFPMQKVQTLVPLMFQGAGYKRGEIISSHMKQNPIEAKEVPTKNQCWPDWSSGSSVASVGSMACREPMRRGRWFSIVSHTIT